MAYQLTKYHSEINKISLKGFTESELNLLMAIMTQMKEQGLKQITFSFKELRDLVEYQYRGIDRFYKELESTYDKLIQCKLGWENEKEIVRFVLFTEYRINKEDQEVTVGVNEKFYWVLNELTSWTTFELAEFVNINGIYAKEIYRRAKEFRMNGYWYIEIEEFKRLLDVPKSYRMTDINKNILNPAKEELKAIWSNFSIEKKYGKGRGRPVVALKFVFDKEDKKAQKNSDGTFAALSPTKNKKIIKAAKNEPPEPLEMTPEEREEMIARINQGLKFGSTEVDPNQMTLDDVEG